MKPAVLDIPQVTDESRFWNQMETEKPTVIDVPKLPDESHMWVSMSN